MFTQHGSWLHSESAQGRSLCCSLVQKGHCWTQQSSLAPSLAPGSETYSPSVRTHLHTMDGDALNYSYWAAEEDLAMVVEEQHPIPASAWG